MSVEDINDKFKTWNPMEKDYQSVKFNAYHTGPGAEIDAELQPGQQALSKSSNGHRDEKPPVPFLMFKNMPEKMTKTALYNICLKHGSVTAVRDSNKNDYFFADFATVADMEAVYRALEHNTYGFKVFVGRNKSKTPLEMHRGGDHDNSPVPPRSVGIDYQNRTLPTSRKQNPRPKLRDTNPDDAHSLERQGLKTNKKNDKFNFRTGRSYVTMSEKTKEFIDNKNSESAGRYSPTNECFDNAQEGFAPSSSYKMSKCSQCEQTCDTVCSRCSVYYCSVACQKNDWQQHRYICGKPKHLQKTPPPKKLSNNPSKKHMTNNNDDEEEPTSSPNSLSKNNNKAPPSEELEYKQQMPRSGNIVVITAISKTNVVFVRSKTYEDNMSYFKTIDSIQAIGKKLQPLKTLPKCGSVVIAKFENQFNRAIVLNISNAEKILVNYMDYGNLDCLKFEDLFEAPQEFITQTPRHALPVLLKGVPDCYMTEEIRKFMYTYLNNINVYIKYKPEDFNENSQVYEVELVDETTEQPLNKIIQKLAKPEEPRNPEEICENDYLDQKPLPSGENVELIVMDNSLMMTGCISCTTIPYALEIQKFQKELQSYVQSLPNKSYTPRVDELCIAKYSEDDLWYRGRCLEVVGDGHPTIAFIDYGNISMIKIEDIRRYPPQFTYPIYTADCEIQGLPESCDENLVAKLEELIPFGGTINCKSVKAFEGEHFYSIMLPNVIKELTTCGLI